jgi:hypothetical protein
MKYENLQTIAGEKVIARNNDDGSTSFIPIDPANSDYQLYLRWLENPEAEENGTIS